VGRVSEKSAAAPRFLDYATSCDRYAGGRNDEVGRVSKKSAAAPRFLRALCLVEMTGWGDI
jgi:hypothetical protein